MFAILVDPLSSDVIAHGNLPPCSTFAIDPHFSPDTTELKQHSGKIRIRSATS
jgi:hypothetical protein